jgi:hypothetical protein
VVDRIEKIKGDIMDAYLLAPVAALANKYP